MVLAISFLEAPLKCRAPNVTLRIGLGIGRLVFRALNIIEAGFAVALIVATIAGHAPARAMTTATVVIALLIAQLAAVRPQLSRRSDRILTGQDALRRAPGPGSGLARSPASGATSARTFTITHEPPWRAVACCAT